MNKLSEGLLSLAKALEALALEHEEEMTQQNDRLHCIERNAERTRNALKGFAENLLNNL
jgi:hypothetical protein